MTSVQVVLQLFLAIAVASRSQAWIAKPSSLSSTSMSLPLSSSSLSTRTSLILGMGSRAAAKWERKQDWLKGRGGEDGATFTSSADDTVPFAAIIGSGRIGGTLAQAGECVVLGRGDTIDADGQGPILVATRNDALDGIVDACPEPRRKDLVFMQNGYLDDFLSSKGLLDNTQVLLYLSVTAKDADPIDGVTTVNPEGLTAATGEHAQAFADRLANLDLKCNVVSSEAYRPAMFEKLMWISTFVSLFCLVRCSLLERL